jgi:hypothetical protein
MAKITGIDLTNEALKLVRTPAIPYKPGGRSPEAGMDCSTMIMWLLEKCGGTNLRAGSNKLWTDHAAWRGTLADAQKQGKLVPGALVLIDDAKGGSNGTPGEMDHVGVYVSGSTVIVHASQSRGGIYPSTLKNGWTHVMWLEGVGYRGEYDSVLPGAPDAGGLPVPTAPPARVGPSPGQAQVITTTSGLYLRKLPGKHGARIKEMRIGAVVDVLRVEGGWAQVRYVGGDGTPHIGWCCVGENGIKYLALGG